MARSKRKRSRRRSVSAEYALSVLPGLEAVAADELQTRLSGASIVGQRRGWVLVHYQGPVSDLLALNTCEDVFAVLFSTDHLPPARRQALPLLTQKSAQNPAWERVMASFSQARTRHARRVTVRVIAQMTGKHGFRRQEVRDAVLSGVLGRWQRWKPVADDAHLEVWAPVIDDWALIAVRLSTRQMRHRTYKEEHTPASLRPTLAAAMVWLTGPQRGDRFCDPMCGAGTILAERAAAESCQFLIGGDLDGTAVNAARVNLRRVRHCMIFSWDARCWPVRDGSLDAVVSNLPFGIKIGSHETNPRLYTQFMTQLSRVLKPGGRAVLLSSEKEIMREVLAENKELARQQEILVGVLGQAARIYVLRKR